MAGRLFDLHGWTLGLDDVKRYIATQETHHQKLSFQDELKNLLEQHGIEYRVEYLE
jgi:putative transposase